MRERTATHSLTGTSAISFTRILGAAVLAGTLSISLTGCPSSSAQNTAQAATNGDPADVNDASAQGSCPAGQVLMSDGSCQNATGAPAQPVAGSTPSATGSAPQQTVPPSSTYSNPAPQQAQPVQQPQYEQQQPPPAEGQSQESLPGDSSYNSSLYDNQNPYDNQTYDQDAYNDGYQQGYEAGIQASQPPPPLPVYAQPICPGPGYLWNPGYWYWGPRGYYWVPGVWVLAPYTGALWTPGWWGFFGGFYRWHHGYWGPHIGFYGGIPYGYGYTGYGFHGGYWNHDRFMYNRSVTNINVTRITNVYNRTVINNVTVNRVSYNGGRGGLTVRPTRNEFNAMREQHVRLLPTQLAHRNDAMQNRQQYASVNKGRPAMAVTTRPLAVHRINPTPAVVNPGVHGIGQPGTRPTVPTNRPGAMPAHTQPVRPAVPAQPVRPTPTTRPQPTHTQPVRPEMRPSPQPGHPVSQSRPQIMRPSPVMRPSPQPQPEMRPTPQRSVPQPRSQPQYMSSPRPQPQHMETPRPQPQHMQTSRPEPHYSAPHETPHTERPHR